MAQRSISVMIGGAAGQGLATVGQLLTKSLMRSGYEILVRQDFMSRVRGGHNTFIIRTATTPILAPRESMDILVAMNQETVDLHMDELGEGGLIFCGMELDPRGHAAVQMPFADLAPKPIFQNVAALGVLASVLGLDRKVPMKLLSETFGKKGEALVKQNHDVLEGAYAWTEERKVDFKPLPAVADPPKRLMLTANDAIALGALAAGANFCSYYPMTPGTSIAQALITHGRKMGVVVEQAEDEIAAMNMVIGASYAGARPIVPTSGGGFALMTEGVSLAGVSETPLVCALAMRPGPATGLATRTEQGDLNLVVYAGHGEFPRAVYAPGTVEDFFHLTYKAFDVAERFQVQAFVLSDQYAANSLRAVIPFDVRSLPEPAAPLLKWEGAGDYERYTVTESGVSPRLVPGFGKHLVLADSHEHTPDGHMTEEIDVRNAMQQKRLRKGQGLLAEVVPPVYDGVDTPELLLVNWGSTQGAVQEAAQDLRDVGWDVATLHFSQVWPLNTAQFMDKLTSARRVVCIEGNSTGQFAALVRQVAGFTFKDLVLKYDGRTFTPEYIVRELGKLGLG